jgi:hypothetical protein
VLPCVTWMRQPSVDGQDATSGLRLHDDVSLCAIGPPQPLRGGPGHLQLPTKYDGYSFCVSEGIENPKTQLVEVAAGTLCEDAKARPQHVVLYPTFRLNQNPKETIEKTEITGLILVR